MLKNIPFYFIVFFKILFKFEQKNLTYYNFLNQIDFDTFTRNF